MQTLQTHTLQIGMTFLASMILKLFNTPESLLKHNQSSCFSESLPTINNSSLSGFLSIGQGTDPHANPNLPITVHLSVQFEAIYIHLILLFENVTSLFGINP